MPSLIFLLIFDILIEHREGDARVITAASQSISFVLVGGELEVVTFISKEEEAEKTKEKNCRRIGSSSGRSVMEEAEGLLAMLEGLI